MNKLDELITSYYENKTTQDNYKKICESQNKEIKSLIGIGTHETEDYKATVFETSRVEFDEDKLITILKASNVKAVKTKEYVDMDELENLIYHNEISADVLKLISDCKHEKKTQTLRVTRK